MIPHRRSRPAAYPLACLILLASGACNNVPIPWRPDRRAVAESLPPVHPPAAAKTARSKPPVQGDPALDAQRFDRIRGDLRRLVAAEETFFAENGSYTEDLGRIGYKSGADTELRFLWASRGGWAVRGTHAGVPGRDCVVYVGHERPAPATIRDGRSAKEGVPVCDGVLPNPSVPVAPGPARPARTAPPAVPPEAGPAPSGAGAAADTSSALDAVTPSVQMRVDLRNLIRSQDSYFGMQGSYAKRTEPLALQYLWHRGVTIKILSATETAWSARATHASTPGKSCVIWVGPVAQRPATEAQRKVPDQPSTPVCDD